MIAKRLALTVPPLRRLLESRDALRLELREERRRNRRSERRLARATDQRGSFRHTGRRPRLVSTVAQGNITLSTYRWEGQRFRMATWTDATDSYTERVRNRLRIEANTTFILEWLSGFGKLLDIGANVGVVSIPVAVSGTQVLSVEALPANYELLAMAAEANPSARITTVHGAAGAERGTLMMAGTGPWAHASGGDDGIRVPMYPVDDLVRLTEFGAPDVIKIDVEGFEREVLRGLVRTLSEVRPVIVIESNSWVMRGKGHYRELLEDLEEAGYQLYLVGKGTLSPRTSKDVQEATVADYVATPFALGDAVGSFEVRELTADERVVLLQSELGLPHTHQWHLASTLVADGHLLPADRRIDEMREALERVDDPHVRAALNVPWS